MDIGKQFGDANGNNKKKNSCHIVHGSYNCRGRSRSRTANINTPDDNRDIRSTDNGFVFKKVY